MVCIGQTGTKPPSNVMRKDITFQGAKGPKVVFSAIEVEKLIHKGYQIYLVHAMDPMVMGPKMEDILIVKEFPNFFPKKLPGLPPDRKIKFAIYLLFLFLFHYIGWH